MRSISATNKAPNSWPIHARIEECEKLLQEYWEENPELLHIVEQKKLREAEAEKSPTLTAKEEPKNVDTPAPKIAARSIFDTELRGAPLREQIRASHKIIQQKVAALDAPIISRTQAHNRKSASTTVEEERDSRSDVVAAQIKAWRILLPNLIRKLSKIPEPRRAKSVKHKLTVLIIFGLFAFIFKLSSRREMNRELTSSLIHENLKRIFPEIDSIPHADTLARLLETINPQDIEAAHINLIKDLIRKKKFKKLLINGCLPITIDGAQKLYRDGLLQDPEWCERVVGNPEDNNKQQYIYALEANITLQNGLTIPLMTEYLHRPNNVLEQTEDKQDNETTAFERLTERLKQYFPRLNIILFMDAMFATQPVMGIIHKNNWEHIIRLPKKKLKDFAKLLNKNKVMQQSIPNQPAYRNRKQSFHWANDIVYGYEWQLNIHLVACSEQYDQVDKKTGEIIECFSEHAWISSIRININNVHELLNLGARKSWLIEDSFNTEKNRGYNYKHQYSYNWNAMKGFHYLMRLGHAISAISEFTKQLKHYIKTFGCSATLKLIKETLFSPWLSQEWYAFEILKIPQLRLQLE